MSSIIEQLNSEINLGISKQNPDALQRHLEFIDTIENCLKIRDYLISKYSQDEEDKRTRLCSQFIGISSHIDFLKQMYKKQELDEDQSDENWELRTIFDQQDFLGPKNKKIYVHYNWSSKHNTESIKKIVEHLVKNEAAGCGQIFFIHKNPQNFPVKTISGVGTIFVSIVRYNQDISQFCNKTFFNINLDSNNIFLINKILVARNVLFDLIQTRDYRGNPSYIYSNLTNGTFGHFNTDLESRFALTQNDGHPINEKNYFDIHGIYKQLSDGAKMPVYIHFLTQHMPDSAIYIYIHKLAKEIREYIMDDFDQTIHLILVVNSKKTGAKGTTEQFGLKDPEHSLIIDIIQLDNLQYNPLKNIYQPKFRLIKKKSPEWNKILHHYGSSEAIPKILYKDPVNKFFGGEREDIYEIIRPSFIKINDDRNTQLNLDVPHRIVK